MVQVMFDGYIQTKENWRKLSIYLLNESLIKHQRYPDQAVALAEGFCESI